MSRDRSHRTDDEGAVLVEFALVAVLLITLLYGIVSFGVLFSVHQSVTQAAADGARAAVAAPQTANQSTDQNAPVRAAARAQVANAASWLHTPAGVTTLQCLEMTPNADGSLPVTSAQPLGCATSVAPCPNESRVPQPSCLTLKVAYAYGAKPVIPAMPFVGQFMPDRLTSTSTIELDGGLVQ